MILSIRHITSSSGRALHFRPKPGFAVPDGGTSASGVVHDDTGRWLNLNEPDMVRAFIDALSASEWPLPTTHSYISMDGTGSPGPTTSGLRHSSADQAFRQF